MPDKNVVPVPKAPAANPNSAPQPLPPNIKHKFESKMGKDLSDVRITVNHQATLVGAEAFTKGKDIFFAPTKYQPYTEAGSQLLAHELTHVVQLGSPKNKGLAKGLVKVNKPSKGK